MIMAKTICKNHKNFSVKKIKFEYNFCILLHFNFSFYAFGFLSKILYLIPNHFYQNGVIIKNSFNFAFRFIFGLLI